VNLYNEKRNGTQHRASKSPGTLNRFVVEDKMFRKETK